MTKSTRRVHDANFKTKRGRPCGAVIERSGVPVVQPLCAELAFA